MPIYKKDQTLPAQPVIILIYGEPGVSKTSLSNTCKNPLILDFDRGFKRSVGRPDVLMPENWKEIETLQSAGDMDSYDTIIPDTAKGALDDFLMAHVIEKDYKLKTNKLKAYGELGEQFKLFVNTLRLKNKDLFIIAHSKSQEDGDIVRKVPDVTGSSAALLLRISDQVGYLSMRNGKRVLSFNPTDTTIGKNVAMLKDIELPLHTSPEWTDFADREIIQKVKNALLTMSEEQRAALNFIQEWRTAIDVIVPEGGRDMDAELKAISKDIAEIKPPHLQTQIRAYLLSHMALIGFKWDAKTKVFVSVVESTSPAENVAEGPKEPPVVADKSPEPEAETRTAETAPVADPIDLKKEAEEQRAALEKQLATPPKPENINKNPNMEQLKEDLFARRD